MRPQRCSPDAHSRFSLAAMLFFIVFILIDVLRTSVHFGSHDFCCHDFGPRSPQEYSAGNPGSLRSCFAPQVEVEVNGLPRIVPTIAITKEQVRTYTS